MSVRVFFTRRSATKLALSFLIGAVLVYNFFFFIKRSSAEEVTLFPTSCEGSWHNSQAVAGEKSTTEQTEGAQSQAAGDEIHCFDFKGDLPANITILSASLHLLWGSVTPALPSPGPSIEESYDPVPVSPEVMPPAEPTTESAPETSPSTPPAQEQQEETPVLPEAPSVPVTNEETSPTSFLPSWLGVNTAQADETSTATELPSDPNVALPSTSPESPSSVVEPVQNAPIPAVSEPAVEEEASGTALFEVTYNVSENSSQRLGFVYQESLEASFALPITLEHIPNLRIKLISRPNLDAVQTIALQGMKLAVTYQKADVQVDPLTPPDRKIDTFLEDITREGVEVIRVKRKEKETHEIWYRFMADTSETPSWNLVAGDDLVNVDKGIEVRDGKIFWVSKEGRALYSFNILTQGLFSEVYDPNGEHNYIDYHDPANEQQRAIFDYTANIFTF